MLTGVRLPHSYWRQPVAGLLKSGGDEAESFQ